MPGDMFSADAVIVTCAGPLPDCGETRSHCEVWFAGNSLNDHGSPSGTVTFMLVLVVPPAPEKLNEPLEIASPPEFCRVVSNTTCKFVLTAVPSLSIPSTS